MSLSSLSTPAVEDAIRNLAQAKSLTLIVGAGTSVESSLPTWEELIFRLLKGTAAQVDALDSQNSAEWAREIMQREDPLAAAAIVDCLAGDGLDSMIVEALYSKGKGPSDYEPGPTSLEIAELKKQMDDALTILTTNYDDLIERALENIGIPISKIRPYVRRRNPLPGTFAVTHLHGYAGRRQPQKKIILTEGHYQQMQRGASWQEQLLKEKLNKSVCLFLGASLKDPNLIRYLNLHSPSGRSPHYALFVRQGMRRSKYQDATEEAITRRWARCGLEIIIVDHFADSAQFIHEVRLTQADPSYVPVSKRADAALKGIHKEVTRENRAPKAFGEHNVLSKLGDQASARLNRSLLNSVLSPIERVVSDPSVSVSRTR